MVIVDPELEDLVLIDHIHSWIEQLITGRKDVIKGGSPIPQRVRSITCQWEMCVIAKCGENHSNATNCDLV